MATKNTDPWALSLDDLERMARPLAARADLGVPPNAEQMQAVHAAATAVLRAIARCKRALARGATAQAVDAALNAGLHFGDLHAWRLGLHTAQRRLHADWERSVAGGTKGPKARTEKAKKHVETLRRRQGQHLLHEARTKWQAPPGQPYADAAATALAERERCTVQAMRHTLDSALAQRQRRDAGRA